MAKKTQTKKPRADGAVLFLRLTKKEKDYLVSLQKEGGHRHLSDWLRVERLKDDLKAANA